VFVPFNVEQFLKDINAVYKKREYPHEGSPCTRYGLAECFFDSSHTNNDACIFQYDSGALAYKCLHDSCQNKKWKDVRELLNSKPEINLKKYWSASPKIGKEDTLKNISYLSGEELLATPIEIEWLIDGMLAMNESTLIHAEGGLGKSMFVMYLMLILASFKDSTEDSSNSFLGEFTIPNRRCSLFLGAENGRATTYDRLKKMCQGSHYLNEGLKRIFFLSQYDDTTVTGESFLNEKFCEFLVGFINDIEKKENEKIDILVIDPLISFTGAKDENNAAEMRPALDAMNRVCTQVKCTPILVHHDKKDGDNYRGSSAINDWARNRISLKRKNIAGSLPKKTSKGKPKQQSPANIPVIRVRQAKCNNFKKFEPFLVKMTEDLHFERIGEQMSPEDMEKASNVVQTLKNLGDYAESTNNLAEAYCNLHGGCKNTAKKYINIAVDNDLILRKSVKSNGKEAYQFYSNDNQGTTV
jgi:KaiC/GvpD/RAD55 family RecA-like ATPase